MHGAWADDGTKRLKFPRLSVSVPPVVAILACDAASGPGPRLGGIGWEASIGEIVHERNTRVRGAAGPGCPGSARQRRGGDGGRAPTRPTWGGAVGPHGWRAAGCPQRSPRRDTRARRGSSSPDNNPYNVRRCGRATWLAGSGLSPAVATAGPPGRDADRRAPTITPTTWGGAASHMAGGQRGYPRRSRGWDSRARNADRRARTRTLYNVGRAAGRVAGGRRAIGGVRLGGTVGQGRGSSSPDKNPVQRGAVYNVG